MVTEADETIDRGSLEVWTYREGVLSAVGHDLLLTLDQVRVERREDTVEATVELASVDLRGAVRDGRVVPAALSGRDHKKILRVTRDEILRVRDFPRARFSGRIAQEGRLSGELEWLGQRQPLAFPYQDDGSVVRADVMLRPSHWGIQPYRALAGTLRVRDEIRVVVRLLRS